MPIPTITDKAAVLDYCFGNLTRAVVDPKHPWHWPIFISETSGRVVVLRKWTRSQQAYTFYTDRRSDKVEELSKHDGACSAVFYHPKHRTQLRVAGTATAMTDEAAKRQLWQAQSPQSLRSYATVHAPGTRLTECTTGVTAEWEAGQPSSAQMDAAYANFAVYTVEISTYDFLQLGTEGQRRSQWFRSGNSSFGWVVP